MLKDVLDVRIQVLIARNGMNNWVVGNTLVCSTRHFDIHALAVAQSAFSLGPPPAFARVGEDDAYIFFVELIFSIVGQESLDN